MANEWDFWRTQVWERRPVTNPDRPDPEFTIGNWGPDEEAEELRSKVVVQFNGDPRAVLLSPNEARLLARMLRQRANQAEGKGYFDTSSPTEDP